MPTILIGLTALIFSVALITTAVVEAVYFVCHLWRFVFDGSALSFNWVEPIPAAGISTGAVLLVTFIATRIMRGARVDDLDSIDVRKTADNNGFRAHLSGHSAESYQGYSVENVDAEKQTAARELGVHSPLARIARRVDALGRNGR